MDAKMHAKRAEAFKALHERPGLFVIPNPWDAGSARMLATLGFEALATTSAGFAFSLGKPDAEGAVDRDETLVNAAMIVEATSLPVSADLENGFGDAPDTCRQTIAPLFVHSLRNSPSNAGPCFSQCTRSREVATSSRAVLPS